MNIRLLNIEDASIVANIENKDTLFNTISALDKITEFFTDNISYKRADKNFILDTDNDFIEINVEVS